MCVCVHARARQCVCGTDVVVLCAGLLAGDRGGTAADLQPRIAQREQLDWRRVRRRDEPRAPRQQLLDNSLSHRRALGRLGARA